MPEEKTCARCGKIFTRRRFGQRLEDATRWATRKFCTKSCANVRDALSEDGYRARARLLRGRSCESCGVATGLHAHHIDGDVSNNSPENIETLCASCHITHHHRARRAGSTAPGRATSRQP